MIQITQTPDRELEERFLSLLDSAHRLGEGEGADPGPGVPLEDRVAALEEFIDYVVGG